MTDEELRAKTLPECDDKYLKRWMKLFQEDFPYNEEVSDETTSKYPVSEMQDREVGSS